jgi:hypothetical protein
MALPEDVVRWVNAHFNDSEKARALDVLRTAVIHTGESAWPRLLRCTVVSSQGVLRRLEENIQLLRIDWRDVIMAAEYTPNDERVYDFNRIIDEAALRQTGEEEPAAHSAPGDLIAGDRTALLVRRVSKVVG